MGIGFLKKMARGKKSRKIGTNEEPPLSDEVHSEIKKRIITERIKTYRELGKNLSSVPRDETIGKLKKELEKLEQRLEFKEEKKEMNEQRRFEIIRWKQREYDNDPEAVESIKTFLSFLPAQLINGLKHQLDSEMGIIAPCPELDRLIPDGSQYDYDLKSIIGAIADDGLFYEASSGNESDLIVCFSKIAGMTVGIIADKSILVFGRPDSDAIDRAVKFIRFCSTFNIPVITITESPCFVPGYGRNWDEGIRQGTKLLWSFSASSSPKIFILTRNNPDSEFIPFSPEHLGADVVFAWCKGNDLEKSERHLQKRKRKSNQEIPSIMKSRKKGDFGLLFPDLKKAGSAESEEISIMPSETRIRIAGFLHKIIDKRDKNPEKYPFLENKARHKNVKLKTALAH